MTWRSTKQWDIFFHIVIIIVTTIIIIILIKIIISLTNRIIFILPPGDVPSTEELFRSSWDTQVLWETRQQGTFPGFKDIAIKSSFESKLRISNAIDKSYLKNMLFKEKKKRKFARMQNYLDITIKFLIGLFVLFVFFIFEFFVFLSYCLFVTLIKCLKGLKSQKSPFESKF